jgi:LmeA-like phospholipid-binding
VLKKIVIAGLVLVLLVYGGVEIWTNNYAESAIAKKLQQDHPEAREARAQVSIPLLFSLLGNGKIRRVGVAAEHVRVARVPVVGALTGAGDIFASDVDVELSGVNIDKNALLQQKKLQVLSIDHLEITTEITQEEASKLLAIVPGVQFEFEPDLVRITIGRIVVGGSFQVEGGTRLRFVPASAVGLPAGLNPMLELTNLPFARCTSKLEIKVEAGKLGLTCAEDNPPLNAQ